MKFKFYVHNHLRFDAPMHVEICRAICVNGRRCSRHVVIGTPYCFQHRKTVEHVEVKESGIEGAGKGLFAIDKTKPANAIIFKKDATIVPYNGQEITTQELDRRYGDYTAPYGVELTRDNQIDGAEDGATHRGIGSLCNHKLARDANAQLVEYRRKVRIRAMKNIRNGQEITLSYGRAYHFNEPTHYTTK